MNFYLNQVKKNKAVNPLIGDIQAFDLNDGATKQKIVDFKEELQCLTKFETPFFGKNFMVCFQVTGNTHLTQWGPGITT